MYPQQIIDALQHVRYPGTGKNLIESVGATAEYQSYKIALRELQDKTNKLRDELKSNGICYRAKGWHLPCLHTRRDTLLLGNNHAGCCQQ
mgnify:CR=1 FL=1